MTNASASDSSGIHKYFVNFNQDSTSLVVGCKNGYRIFSLSNVEDLCQIYSNEEGNVDMVERLFGSSLVATVWYPQTRHMRVCHFKKGTEICNYSFPDRVLALRMNRGRLVVRVPDSLYIHDINTMKILHTIRDTPEKSAHLCALTITHESHNNLLAYPGSIETGAVQIFDVHNLTPKILISAHTSFLAAIAFNATSTMIATASTKGTVIRVFCTTTGNTLYEFRRGLKRCVDISSLAFSMCGQFLCSSSNTETVHVFKLTQPSEKSSSVDDGSWMNMVSSFIPTQIAQYTQFRDRAFTVIHLPTTNTGKKIVTMVTIQGSLKLLVATEEAILYVYNFDQRDGSATLYKQHYFGDRLEASGSTSTTTEGSAILGSYAGIVKGNPVGQMSESDKLREMAAATESPPKDGFHFHDESEYPPLTHKSD